MATTIDKYCYINCRYLPPFFDHRYRIVWSRIELVRESEQIQHPAVREILSFIGEDNGVEIHHDGDLPARAGLGSSSSFVVGLLHSMYALRGITPSKDQLARDAILVERERLRETVGSQDQVSAAFGGFNRIDFDGQREFRLTPIELNKSRLNELEDHLMLVFTGRVRTASEIAGDQVKAINTRSVELTTMQQSVDEAVNILCSGSDIYDFGRLLDETWKTKRSLTSRITTTEIDDIYKTAREAGALGGKLLGAGGGGFMLLFVPSNSRKQVERKLDSLLQVPFRFDNSGSSIIFNNEREATS